jgi:hypothetical protein
MENDNSFDVRQAPSRELFLEAAYFDLGVTSSSQPSYCRSGSEILDNENTKWVENSVRSITAVQEAGVTMKSDAWIKERRQYMQPR